jgi:hypothetical protein
MVRASRAVRLAADSGQPLPEVPVLRPLYDEGVVLRKGSLVMIAGPSGGGKSTLAQYMLAMMDIPALAIVPDMDDSESIPRLIATLSGIPVDEVREDVESYGHFLEDCEIDFCWDDSPSVEDIYLELDRYVEMYDAWPEVILVDNLLDIDAGDGEHEAQMFVMTELKTLAKKTEACVIVLTHTKSEVGSDYTKPQSRERIKYQVDQKPQLILTLGREGDLFRISVVKDRNSKATDPTAKRFITIMWRGDTASFEPFDADWHRYNGGPSE